MPYTLPYAKAPRDPTREKECLEWISVVTGERFPPGVDLLELLKDGTILCRLMNKLSPGIISKINSGPSHFKLMENINYFTDACRRYGVPVGDLFQTVDLWEGKDFGVVIDTIYALGRTTYQHPEWKGPWLGPRPAEQHHREWTDAEIRAHSNVIGLQAGSNQGASQAGDHYGQTRKVLLGK